MNAYANIREKHIKRVLFIILTMAFIFANWGHTLNAIYHVVLTARTFVLDTVDGQLAKDLGLTIISFGHTVTRVIVFVLFWLFINRVLKWYDYDAPYRPHDFNSLKQENTVLMTGLQESHENIKGLFKTIDELVAYHKPLSKFQDRVVELNVEIEKLSAKTLKPENVERKGKSSSELDLFQVPIHLKKSSPKSTFRKRRPKLPKF